MQGDHLFRHLLDELSKVAGAEHLVDEIWTIRSEVISPVVKARTLLRYLELFVRRAEEVVAGPRRRPGPRMKVALRSAQPSAPDAFPAVGRDVGGRLGGRRRTL